MVPKFTWPKPEDDADRKLIADVVEHKCHVVGVPEGRHGPRFAFSVGLFLHFEHPEIIIFGVDHRVAATAINDIRDMAEKGHRFKDGDVSDQIFDNYRVAFAKADPSFYPYYLGTAIWFYRSLSNSFPVLQLVWPDKTQRFPWDQAFDRKCKDRQPVLNKKASELTDGNQ